MYKNTRPWMSLFSMIFMCGTIHVDAFLGVTWGRFATQRFVPSMVVDLLLQNGIQELRLIQASYNVLEAFAETNIRLTVSVQEKFLRKKPDRQIMDQFIYDRVKKYADRGVKFRYVYVGNQPFTTSFYKPDMFIGSVVFMKMVRESLDRFDLKDIKVSTPHFTDVLLNVTKPSDADFREDIKPLMLGILKYLSNTGAPFIFNIYPIYSIYCLDFDVEFAYFDNKSKFRIIDGNNTYTNLFTFLYDALVCALTKAGYGDLDIVIGQIGWPTDGDVSANEENAERFYRGLLKYIGRKEGTPLRPNRDISVYLSSLTDENLVQLELGAFQRHWGIYKHDGRPKYKIDFSMQGRDIEPTTAKGTITMPKRWCVFDGKTEHNETDVFEDFKFACKNSDCTAFETGATCDHLSFPDKVSYAYNMRYQMENQNKEKCELTGAMIVPDDPSTPDCEFPIEILTAEAVDGGVYVY